jgi:hypothetical protein
MKLTPSFFVQQPILRLGFQGIHLPGQLALQICRLILVYNTLLGQPVDHGSNLRQLLTGRLILLYSPQVTDRIPRGLAIVLVTIPALFSLPYVFLRCLMISHEHDNFRTAKVRAFTGITKFMGPTVDLSSTSVASHSFTVSALFPAPQRPPPSGGSPARPPRPPGAPCPPFK